MYNTIKAQLQRQPQRWLVTGVAGFIGSNLAENLLKLNQEVVGLDDFSTGYPHNLDDIRRSVGPEAASRFHFIEGSICDFPTCQRACDGVSIVLHQAALGSVPRSIEDPLASHLSNVSGFVNMLEAARQHHVQRFVYASSSSIYGDEPTLPKTEANIGLPLSPYAATKWIDEIYADVWLRIYNLQTVGLRYFNVFGPRQDPNGAYAAVIPRWIEQLRQRLPCTVYGDGLTSRDFCFIQNVVQANILAATTPAANLSERTFNIAYGDQTTLIQLHDHLRQRIAASDPAVASLSLHHEPFRSGDIRHSLADISRARSILGYNPSNDVPSGLDVTVQWFLDGFNASV